MKIYAPSVGHRGNAQNVFTTDIDLDARPWAPYPSIGASGVYATQTSPRIACLRVYPPTLEVHEHNARTPKNS